MLNKHSISWFEIPAQDLSRAQKFYETILEIEMVPLEFPGFQMRIFPTTEQTQDSISGALVKTAEGFYFNSETQGVLIYLNGNPDVQIVLGKVEAAGGKVVVPKTQISEEHGYMGIIVDTEGNRVGFHSLK